MTRLHPSIIVGLLLVGAGLAGCNGSGTPGTATPAPASTSAEPDGAASEVPKVQNPLPAKVLEGNPCDVALTPNDVKSFIGTPDPAKPGENVLGPKCDWDNAAGSGAGITVFFHTKDNGGLALTYKNIKPKAARWVDNLQPVQGYPIVGYLAPGDNPGVRDNCHLDVGISDTLTYSVDLQLGDSARNKGIDACEGGRDVADRVMTNIKGRA
ncbi:DUF3558 family protein [Amycolatopsis sp. NPDC059657]|uniref:DUF3558 family protein n=1 Tax=Amycolatopsis sp. NPDC059657 TaxID=3346899 RepID=UPI003670426A